MKRLVLFFGFLPILLLAQTPITGGDVFGIWDSTGSPYLIDGDIYVPSGSTFVIEAGCTLKFLGYYQLRVDSGATFKIKGTVDAPVVVMANDSFRGIKLNYVSACTLEYMKLSQGRRGITIENSEVVIRNSEVDSCKYCLGGAISGTNSSIEIDNCEFHYNLAQTMLDIYCYKPRGGVGYFRNSEIMINSSDFTDNTSLNTVPLNDPGFETDIRSAYAGALLFSGSNVTIQNCVFKKNCAIAQDGWDEDWIARIPAGSGGDAGGGAIALTDHSAVRIINTLFVHNNVHPGAGGRGWEWPSGSRGRSFGFDIFGGRYELDGTFPADLLLLLNSSFLFYIWPVYQVYFIGYKFASVNSYIPGIYTQGSEAFAYNSFITLQSFHSTTTVIENCLDSIPPVLCCDGSPSLGSPLIDAGIESVTVCDTVIHAPATDLAGNPRPMGDGVDIGAYEFDPDNPSICSDIHRGWNLLAFPTADTVNAFDYIPYYIPHLFVWNAELQRYEIQDSIVGPTQPFLAFSPKDTAGHFSLPSILDSVTYTLYPGWNLIGTPGTAAAASRLTGLPEVEGPVYGLFITEDGSVEYQPVELLIPGYGYWVFATDTVEITLP